MKSTQQESLWTKGDKKEIPLKGDQKIMGGEKYTNDRLDRAAKKKDGYTDKYDNEYGSEFSDSDYFIFPVEILTWLAIRRNLGLPEFIADNNELMRMQINSLPEDSTDYTQDELINKCKAKLLADNPGIKFEFLVEGHLFLNRNGRLNI